MKPETDPEIARVELRTQSIMQAEQRARNLRRWWSAMIRSDEALARPFHKPFADYRREPESIDRPASLTKMNYRQESVATAFLPD